MTDFDPDRIRARLSEVGEEWAELDAAATLLEETKKSVLADLMLKSGGDSAKEKETIALAHDDYRKHLQSMVEARREANKAKVKYETGKMWVELKRSQESTRRAEMGMR